MGLEWRLRAAAAERGITTAAELRLMLIDRADWPMSLESVRRLLSGAPGSIKPDVIAALCSALRCMPDDLLVRTAT
jgi:DNA-binding Xre family transcriptional regulator